MGHSLSFCDGPRRQGPRRGGRGGGREVSRRDAVLAGWQHLVADADAPEGKSRPRPKHAGEPRTCRQGAGDAVLGAQPLPYADGAEDAQRMDNLAASGPRRNFAPPGHDRDARERRRAARKPSGAAVALPRHGKISLPTHSQDGTAMRRAVGRRYAERRSRDSIADLRPSRARAHCPAVPHIGACGAAARRRRGQRAAFRAGRRRHQKRLRRGARRMARQGGALVRVARTLRGVGARAHRNQEPESRSQQSLRLLHRNTQVFGRESADGLRAEADARGRGTLHHRGAQTLRA